MPNGFQRYVVQTDTRFQDEAMFDEWSIQHFTTGAIVGGLGILNLGQYFVLHTLFEIWENTIGIVDWRKWGWEKYEGDSVANMVGDTVSGCAGFYIVNRITEGKMAPPFMLAVLIGLGAFISYHHPPPPDKVMKGLVSLGVVGFGALAGYLLFHSPPLQGKSQKTKRLNR